MLLGTEYDQLSILNDDFTLNLDKLAVQVCSLLDSGPLQELMYMNRDCRGMPLHSCSTKSVVQCTSEVRLDAFTLLFS